MSPDNTSDNGTKLKVTSPADWRQAKKRSDEGFVIEFPSGMVARIRPVSFDLFVHLGKIPDTLTPVLAKAVGLGTKTELDDGKPMTSEQLRKWAEGNTVLQNEFAKCCLMEPECVDEPNENQISPQDMEDGDKAFLIGFFNQPASVLKNFCRSQKRDLELMATHAGNGTAPVETGQTQEVGTSELSVG